MDKEKTILLELIETQEKRIELQDGRIKKLEESLVKLLPLLKQDNKTSKDKSISRLDLLENEMKTINFIMKALETNYEIMPQIICSLMEKDIISTGKGEDFINLIKDDIDALATLNDSGLDDAVLAASDSDDYLQIAEYLEDRGDRSKAQEFYQKALDEADPDNQEEIAKIKEAMQ